MPITLVARKVRLSFDKHLINPTEPKGKKSGKRQCNLIASEDTTYFRLDKGVKTAVPSDKLTEIIEEALKQKFSGKVPPKYDNWAIRPNKDSVSQQTGERFTGYEDDDYFYFSPSRFEDQGPPAFVRRDGSVINVATEDGLAEARRLFYAGCYVTAKINVAAYEAKEDNVTKRGVTTFLEAVQFLADGERFGGGDADASGLDCEETEGDIDDI